jgi:UDP-glucose 4-epimerase
MRVLITGGAGFIGSHTADLLIANDHSVIIFDNLATGKLSNLNLQSPLLKFVQADVLNYSELLKAVAQSDAVLHLAALPSVPKSIEDPLQSHAVNMAGFLNVLQAIREVKKPMRLVYASSSAVYGDVATLPCCDENSAGTALSPYALQKIQNEQYAALYSHLFGIHSLGLRYFNVYGTRQDPQSIYSGVISRFLEGYQQGKALTVFGDGKQSRDFVHVSDIARANYLALQSDYSGVMNIATGQPETLCDLISYMKETGGKNVPINFESPRIGDIRVSYGTTKKAEAHLQFKSEVTLREGIKRLMREFSHV